MKSPSKLTTTLIASLALALSAGAASNALADRGPKGGHGKQDIATLLNLDADRAAQVNTILENSRAQKRAALGIEAGEGKKRRGQLTEAQREEMKRIHDETRSQLAAVLSAEEMLKLDEARSNKRGHRGDHRGGPRGEKPQQQ